VTYVCNGGYTVTGAPVATCQANGMFSTPPATCTPVGCSAPPAVANAGAPTVSGGAGGGNSDTYGAMAAYTCNTGFTKSGADPTCGGAGTWSAAPTCAANADAGSIVDSGTDADAGCSVTSPADWANWPVSDSPNKFTDNGDGTIYDANTGLTWMKTPMYGSSGSWHDNALCKCPWRPPQRIELLSIVDYTQSKPAANTTYFNIVTNQKIWSDTFYAINPQRAWDVDFTDGSLVTDDITYGSAAVLCVKGSSTAPASRYTVSTGDAGVAEVLDNGTDLHWQQATVAGSHAYATAASQCASPYRLPAVSELMTLIDSSLTTSPAIDPLFPGIGGSDTFWASTLYLPEYPTYAYTWDMNVLGSSAGVPDGSSYRVRCVR
jgi:hypothetical protein